MAAAAAVRAWRLAAAAPPAVGRGLATAAAGGGAARFAYRASTLPPPRAPGRTARRWVVGIVVTAVAGAAAAWAARPKLGGEADAMMRRGLRAALKKDWKTANAAFEEALAVRTYRRHPSWAPGPCAHA